MPIISPAIMMGESMVKILFALLVLQPTPSNALPVSNPLDLDADGSGTPKNTIHLQRNQNNVASSAVSEGVLDSNECVRKWNTTVTGDSGRNPKRPVESLDQCSHACKKDPTCEVFLYQEENESSCTLFSGNATIEEQSGNGTVGYCLSGKFCIEFSLNF